MPPGSAPHAVIERAPSGNGYTKIYSNWSAFAALKADGSITAWGGSDTGGTGAPFKVLIFTLLICMRHGKGL
jgi:hypothetical protein